MDKTKIRVMGKNVTLWKRPESENVYFYFSHEGKKYKGSTGVPDFNMVTELDMGMKISNVIQGSPIKKKKTILTFATLFRQFQSHQKDVGVSGKTMKDNARMGKFLIEFFGNKDVTKLGKASDYLKYWNWKKDYYKNNPDKAQITYTNKRGQVIKGKKMKSNGPIAIDREIILYRQTLTWAQRYGKTPSNLHIDVYQKYKGVKEPTKVLTKDQYVTITKFMKIDNPYYQKIVRFINNTGVRWPGEVLPLKWKHIDFNKHTISIEGRKRGNRGTRSRVDSLIPMTNRTKEILEELYDRPSIPKSPEDFVFVNNKGIQVKSIRKYWQKTLRHLGIDDDYKVYSLRHMYAIRMIRRPDISLKLLSELLGHSTVDMVQRHYARWIDIDKKVNTILASEEYREKLLDGLNE